MLKFRILFQKLTKAGLEKKLLEKLYTCNLDLKEFPDPGVLVELSPKEMEAWSTADQEDDVPDYGRELKIREVDRIASLVDKKKLTKGEVVGNLYKIFNLFDLLAPTMIKSKMLLQKFTKADLEWDEPLQSELAKEETYETEGDVPEEMVRDTAAQEDITADDATVHDLLPLSRTCHG